VREQINPVTAALAHAEREKCYLCGAVDLEPDGKGDAVELRPYGPNGAWICFYCMKSSPEREAEAKKQFGAQLEASGKTVLIGERTGPRPLNDGGKDG
jgi:hypothetical protein